MQRPTTGVRRRSPPDDYLRAGTRERDVGETQRLAGVFARVRCAALCVADAVLAADVEDPPALVVVHAHRIGRRVHVAIPEERRIDDGELEALAAMHGDDLHRLCVGLEPAAQLL